MKKRFQHNLKLSIQSVFFGWVGAMGFDLITGYYAQMVTSSLVCLVLIPIWVLIFSAIDWVCDVRY